MKLLTAKAAKNFRKARKVQRVLRSRTTARVFLGMKVGYKKVDEPPRAPFGFAQGRLRFTEANLTKGHVNLRIPLPNAPRLLTDFGIPCEEVFREGLSYVRIGAPRGTES